MIGILLKISDPETGELFDDLLDNGNLLSLRSRSHMLAGIIWVQGETELKPYARSQYENRLTHLL